VLGRTVHQIAVWRFPLPQNQPSDEPSVVHQKPRATRRVLTGRTLISGPSTSRVWFLCWHVRSTTVRDLRLLMTTVSMCEPQTMTMTLTLTKMTRSGHLGQCELRSRAARSASSRVGQRAGGADTSDGDAFSCREECDRTANQTWEVRVFLTL
jgi:hypothetical protein